MMIWIPNMRKGTQSLLPFLAWLPLEDASVLEIGCFAGDGTLEFMACDKIKSVDCVDLFQSGYDKADTASEFDMVEVMQKWAFQVGSHAGLTAVNLHAFQDVSDLMDGITFDLCYVDANHLEPFVYSDVTECIERFKPKVIAGHDYGSGKHPGVKKAVDRIFGSEKIKLFPDSSWAVVL